MAKRTLALGMALATTVWMVGVFAQAKPPAGPAAPVVVLETARGTIEIEMSPKDAPKSVAHILTLVRQGFYRGHRFHWVQPGVIQVGDPQSRNMAWREKWGTSGSRNIIGVAEFGKKSFDRGTVGFAHRGVPTQASSQFFILRGANTNLNGKYTMLGRVTKGMDVVDKIEREDLLKLAHVKGEPAK